MKVASFSTVLMLVFSASFATADTPYEINGLHTELVFSEAVAKAESLGGSCQITTSRKKDRRKSAICEYRPCLEESVGGNCKRRDLSAPGPTYAAQPIERISLEAATEDAKLTRITLQYAGDLNAIVDGLLQDFGNPEGGKLAERTKSWTPDHRDFWKRGDYRIGLVYSLSLILMTVDRVRLPVDSDTTL